MYFGLDTSAKSMLINKNIFKEGIGNMLTDFQRANNLFEITFISPEKERISISSDMLKCTTSCDGVAVFEDKEYFDCRVVVTENHADDHRKLLRINVENHTDCIIESINFPMLVLECNMKGQGGSDTIFWPSMEGTLVEDVDNTFVSFVEKRLGGGYCGITPGAATMQYMAFFSGDQFIYYAAHDEKCNLKDFEYRFIDDNHVEFLCKLYPGGCKNYEMDYDMVIGCFAGDWQDAAEVYRTWLESSNMLLPPKLSERTDLPAWLEESPVTMLYPVRGTKDSDRDEQMAPNCYYPYTNILPVLDMYADKLKSKMLPLLMHWEGSAPWATPYIWPPYGDLKNFEKMVNEIHKRGHLVGVYASGLGITTQGVTDSSYHNEEEYENGGWKECTCRDITGEPMITDLAFVRSGYDVCPSCRKVKDTMVAEAMKIANADIDYYQAFDQNLGGLPRFCWSDQHNHPPAPGKWISDEMSILFGEMQDAIGDAGKEMVLGCELAASETAMRYLPFNDLRWFTAFRQGIPVPAYSYIYHEYINNYMGNNNGIEWFLKLDEAPDNLLYRTAYSFLAGDMLTIVLGADGKIGWCWNAPHDGSYPDQDIMIEFIKNANAWRTGFTKKYLRYGRMLKCERAQCERSLAAVCRSDKKIFDDNILCRKYQAKDGTVATFFVNRTSTEQVLTFKEYDENARLYTSPADSVKVPGSKVLAGAEIVCIIENENM